MHPEILYFLSQQRLAALTVEIADLNLHSAVMHIAHQDNPFRLFFFTDKASKKCSAFLHKKEIKAAVVIGFSEKEFTTLQMSGFVREVPKKDLAAANELYFLKYPEKKKFVDKDTKMMIEFIPTSWTYIDYEMHPKRFITSS